MNKKLLIIPGIIIILAILAYLFLRGHPGQISVQQQPLPSSMASGVPYGYNSMVFSNGRSFVAYNFKTGQTRPLSPDNISDEGLANVDSLSVASNQQFIVFHNKFASTGTLLYQQIEKAGLSNSLFGSWWVYNVSSQTFKLLPSDVIMAKASGNNVYTLVNNSGVESIVSYRASDLQQQSSISVSGVSNFYTVQGGYLLQTPNSQVQFTKDGVITQTLYKSTIIDGVSSDGRTAIGIMSGGGKQDLELLKFQDSSSRVIANNVVGQAVWSSTLNEAVYFSSKTENSASPQQLNSYDLAFHKNVAWGLKGRLNFTLVAPLGQHTTIASQSVNSFSLIGDNLPAIKIPPVSYSRTIDTVGGTVTFKYSTQNDILSVSSPTSFTNEQTAIYQQLNKDDYNPYLLDIQLNQ